MTHPNSSPLQSLDDAEQSCVRALLPFYIVMQQLWGQRPILLSEFDDFIMNFEETASRHYDIPPYAFTYYRHGGKNPPIEAIESSICKYVPEGATAFALRTILTRKTRMSMMLFINVLNPLVFANIIENVERQRHSVFDPNTVGSSSRNGG